VVTDYSRAGINMLSALLLFLLSSALCASTSESAVLSKSESEGPVLSKSESEGSVLSKSESEGPVLRRSGSAEALPGSAPLCSVGQGVRKHFLEVRRGVRCSPPRA
jgi:hypothetical protein